MLKQESFNGQQHIKSQAVAKPTKKKPCLHAKEALFTEQTSSFCNAKKPCLQNRPKSPFLKGKYTQHARQKELPGNVAECGKKRNCRNRYMQAATVGQKRENNDLSY